MHSAAICVFTCFCWLFVLYHTFLAKDVHTTTKVGDPPFPSELRRRVSQS